MSYLVKACPSYLDVRAANGVTPLLLACRLGRLDAVKILIDAGADQTVKDRRRNNLLHAALSQAPSARRLRPLLALLDRDLLAPMLKERTRLEHGGRTPLHDWLLDIVLSHRNRVAGATIRVFKLLVELSPETAKQSLRMLDGAGDMPLHTLLRRDADPKLVRALLDFDPSLLFYENAVGRTPGEVAHDRFLADNIKAKQWTIYFGDKSVSSLVTRPPSTFVKNEHRDQAKEHETKSIVAQNWRLCTEFMTRADQPKRMLVSLHSANLVAQRLGEQFTKDRYCFRLAEKTEDDAVSTSSESQNGDAGDDKTAGLGNVCSLEKPKRRREDIITERYHAPNDAWKLPGELDGDGESDGEVQRSTDDDDDDEKVVGATLRPCPGCGRYHTKAENGGW